VLITSAEPGGKSIIAASLNILPVGQQVFLIDGDLRRATLQALQVVGQGVERCSCR
jgi:hypothetical protein